MNNNIIKADLTNILKAVKTIKTKVYKNHMPVFNTVQFRTDNKAVVTNLETRIEVKILSGSIDTNFQMDFNDLERMEKICHKDYYIKAYLNAENKLIYKDFFTQIETLAFSNYPTANFPESLSCENREQILKLESIEPLLTARRYVSSDDTRKVLHGININSESLVATSGKFLYVYNHCNNGIPADFSRVIPVKDKYLNLFKKSKNDIVISNIKGDTPTYDYCMIESEIYTVLTKYIEGNYPNYKYVIPEKFDNKIECIPVKQIESFLKIQPKDSNSYSYYDMNILQPIFSIPEDKSNLFALGNEHLNIIIDSGFDSLKYNNQFSAIKFIKTSDNYNEYVVMMPCRA